MSGGSAGGDRAEAAYADAIAERGLADLRPACRALLRRLKTTAPDRYAEGVQRYEEDLVPAVAGGSVDPVDAWLEYGTWLAGQLSAGRAVGIDPTGRSTPLSGPLPAGWMALYLPDKDQQPAVLLAAPARLTPPQDTTRALLCR